jgi:hypothetical protein
MKKIGKISPFFTCSRSLADELGLKCGDDFIEGEIRCLGLLFDTLRAQPFCVFYIRSCHENALNKRVSGFNRLQSIRFSSPRIRL